MKSGDGIRIGVSCKSSIPILRVETSVLIDPNHRLRVLIVEENVTRVIRFTKIYALAPFV